MLQLTIIDEILAGFLELIMLNYYSDIYYVIYFHVLKLKFHFRNIDLFFILISEV